MNGARLACVVLAVIATPASAAPAGKSDICHWDANRARVSAVANNSVESHFAQHGDSYPSQYFRDSDGDGFGDPSELTDRCPNVGYVANDTDCNDADPSLSPNATEVLGDGIDNDCDPLTLDDEACDAASGVGSSAADAGDSCAAILVLKPCAFDGNYWIDTDVDGDTSDAFLAYCDMTTDDGGWTLVQVGLNDNSNDLRTDSAVGILDDPTPDASAKLARATIAEIAQHGAGEFRYGHDDFGWLYLFALDPTWIATGAGGTGYGTFVAPYTSDITYGGGGFPGSRFAWPVNGVPEVCPNTDGSTSECGLGLHYGTWEYLVTATLDGVYMNYSILVYGNMYVHYSLWAR